MNPSERIHAIETRLRTAFSPEHMEIVDESHRHAGHASAGGGGHYIVKLVAQAFSGKGLVERHRLVFDAVNDLMKSGEVHALSIQAKTPEESS